MLPGPIPLVLSVLGDPKGTSYQVRPVNRALLRCVCAPKSRLHKRERHTATLRTSFMAGGCVILGQAATRIATDACHMTLAINSQYVQPCRGHRTQVRGRGDERSCRHACEKAHERSHQQIPLPEMQRHRDAISMHTHAMPHGRSVGTAWRYTGKVCTPRDTMHTDKAWTHALPC